MLPLARLGTPIQVFHTIVYQLSFSVSIISATLLAICRLIAIKFPFYRINQRHIFATLVLISVVRLLNFVSTVTPLLERNGISLFIKYGLRVVYVSLENPQLILKMVIIKLVFVPLFSVVGITASTVTIYLLHLQPNMSQNSNTRKSSRAIAYMNMCNVLITIGYISAVYFMLRRPLLYFCGTTVFPIFGSAFNPTVRFLACSDIRKYFTQQRRKLTKNISKTQKTATE